MSTEEEVRVEPVVEKEEEPVTKKDPRRVEAGKKLAAISKAAKEKKMRDKIKKEMSSSSWFNTLPFKWIIAGGSILIFGSYLTIRIFSSSPSPKPAEPKKEVKSKSPKPEPKPEKKFESLG